MLPPIPRCSGWASASLISPSRISLPRYGSRVGLHIVLFGACSAFTRVAACTLALSPNRDTLIEGFSHFVTSMTAPIASGWSESPGGACTHWKAPPCHGARRVEVWRGGGRSNISVAAPFVWRCLTGSAVAPFPHPAHRTGLADFPHPALGQDVTPSPTPRRAPAGSGVRARSTRKGARVDRSRPCVA